MTGIVTFFCSECRKQVTKHVKNYEEAEKTSPYCDECNIKTKEKVDFT